MKYMCVRCEDTVIKEEGLEARDDVHLMKGKSKKDNNTKTAVDEEDIEEIVLEDRESNKTNIKTEKDDAAREIPDIEFVKEIVS